MKRLAVIFPGIGYTAEKPLLYYSRRIAERFGYESLIIPYSGFPKKVKGDRSKLKKACEIALLQADEFLADTDLTGSMDILMIGKSIGTVAAANIAAKSSARDRIRLLLYTPLEETFAFPLKNALVFTGSADPWTGGKENRIPALCKVHEVSCFVVEGANHSLETPDPQADIRNLKEIMDRTTDFIREEQIRRIAYHEALLQNMERELSKSGAQQAEAALQESAEKLAEYYGSDDWKLDFADDEAGRLPKDLKRGVLSEDGIYNVLDAWHERLGD